MVSGASLVDATVVHRRTDPFDYTFRHRTTSWLVDAAEPNAAFPRWVRPWMRIRSRDHLAPGDRDLHAKVRDWLAEHDVGWSAHSVTALVNAWTAGHVFDPLTTYFCFDASGRLEGILAEVHNTYGGRHCYALPAQPDLRTEPSAGTLRTEPSAATQPLAIRTAVEKTFYVSPFFAVEGRYDIRARLSSDAVAVSITLTRDGRRVFTGSVSGPLVPATRRTVLRALLRNPFASQRVTALIHLHGIRLWLRRLPVVPRTPLPPKGRS